ncbi:MAG: PQQ-binding-like beta-propeller repeat protein [Planctomycetaceae bacterium]|nr:PQQ-binding-like beta-propeller repeat protein [Planctomycetaceae bacterium]
MRRPRVLPGFWLLMCGWMLFVCAVGQAQQQAEQAEQAKGPKNPVGKLFQQIDRQIRGVDDETADAEDEFADRAGRDKFDVRTPQNPENARRLLQADRLIEQERWQDVVEILQYLLDRPADSLVLTPEGEWESIRKAVERRLRDMPEAGRRSYVNRYGAMADQLLEQAIQEQREALLIEVRRRFRYLNAGHRAGELLVARWGLRGDHAPVIDLAEELVEETGEQRWAVIAALALDRLGERTTAEERLARVLGWQQILGAERSLSPADWFEAQPVPAPARTSNAPISLSDPLLLANWTESRMARYSVQEQYRLLSRDMDDQQRAALPQAEPVFAENLLITRDLAGLRARDVATGQTVWQELVEEDFESRLAPTPGPEWNFDEDLNVVPYNGLQVDQHPLSTVLFRDQVTSRMSVIDGRLYSVEAQDPLATLTYNQYWRGNPQQRDESWSVNELVCRDSQTGRRLWTVGGPELEPLFTRSLAGYYFFGPPVEHQGELLVIGERDSELSLIGLEPQSGLVLWSQNLATSGRPLREDPIRRMWLCQPVVARGLILCPTTCGWLVAVNEYTHQLEWVYRYTEKEEGDGRRRFRGGMGAHSIQPLNQRWFRTQPILAGNRILLSPAELPDEFGSTQPMLICIDFSGLQQWRVPKENHLYVAGLYENRVLLVGKTEMQAIDLESHAVKWQLSYPSDSGMPTGIGIALGKTYLLPLGERTLLHVDLETGKESGTQTIANHLPTTLGNLSTHEGLLFSVSPSQLNCFPARDAEMRRWSQLAMDDPYRVLHEVQMQLLANNRRGALERLDLVPAMRRDQWPVTDRELASRIEWDLLTSLCAQSEDVAEAANWIARLERLASVDQEGTLLRLQAQQALRRGELDAAVAQFLQLLLLPEPPMFTEETRETRLDVWVGRQLEQLAAKLDETQQREFDARAKQLIAGLDPQEQKLRERVALALSFHPAGNQLLLQLAREDRDRDQLSRAAIQFRRVTVRGQPEQRLTAITEMAEMFADRGHFREALGCWQYALTRSDLPQQIRGQSQREFLTTMVQQLRSRLGTPAQHWETVWKSHPLQVDRLAGRPRRGIQVTMEATTDSPTDQGVMTQRRLSFDAQANRLKVDDYLSGGLWWSVPLRLIPEQQHQATVGYEVSGSVAYLLHRGVVHALGISDREILWTFVPDVREESARRLRAPGRPRQLTMSSPSSFLATSGTRASGQNGYLVGAGDFVILLQLRKLTAVDALTGDILWTDSDYLNASNVLQQDDQLITFARSGQTRLRHPLDGSPLSEEKSPLGDLQQVYQIRPGQTVSFEQVAESSPRQWKFVARESGTFEQRWEQTFVDADLMVRVDQDHVGILRGTGDMVLLNVESGTLTELGAIPESIMTAKRRVTLLADATRIFAVVEHGSQHSIYVNIPSIRAGGTIFGFSRTGGLLWSQETGKIGEAESMSESESSGDQPPLEGKEQNQKGKEQQQNQQKPKNQHPTTSLTLLTSDFESTPALVFLGDQPIHLDRVYYRDLRVVCLDKQTGNPLLNWKRPSDQGGFHRMNFDYQQGVLELDTYNFRLRISPAQEQR